ncbi:MAG: hypothetical protein K9N21_20305 [Deltaproteobacteria bacterium]|nr:hypothetical protein [Deltaproteobacteria bacterium]
MLQPISEKKKSEHLRNIFITKRWYEKEEEFKCAAKYSESFESLRAFLDYLKHHEITIGAITNEKTKVPASFSDILLAGFPFTADNSYLEYLHKALTLYTPVFFIKHKGIPCDLIVLPKEWDTAQKIGFSCFFRESKIQQFRNENLTWSDSDFECPRLKQLSEEIQGEFANEGKPCENAPRYYGKDLINAIAALYNNDTFERIRISRIVPITTFSSFFDAILWMYCIGEEIFSAKIEETRAKSRNNMQLFADLYSYLQASATKQEG